MTFHDLKRDHLSEPQTTSDWNPICDYQIYRYLDVCKMARIKLTSPTSMYLIIYDHSDEQNSPNAVVTINSEVGPETALIFSLLKGMLIGTNRKALNTQDFNREWTMAPWLLRDFFKPAEVWEQEALEDLQLQQDEKDDEWKRNH